MCGDLGFFCLDKMCLSFKDRETVSTYLKNKVGINSAIFESPYIL